MAMVRDLLNEQRTFSRQNKSHENEKTLATAFSRRSSNVSTPSLGNVSGLTPRRQSAVLGKDDVSDTQSETSLVQSVVQKWKAAFRREPAKRELTEKRSPASERKEETDTRKASLQGEEIHGAPKDDSVHKHASNSKTEGKRSKIPMLRSSVRRTSIGSDGERDTAVSHQQDLSGRYLNKAGASEEKQMQDNEDKTLLLKSYQKIKVNKDRAKTQRLYLREWNQLVKQDGEAVDERGQVSDSRANQGLLLGVAGKTQETNQHKTDHFVKKVALRSLYIHTSNNKLMRRILRDWRRYVLLNKSSSKLFEPTNDAIMQGGFEALREYVYLNRLMRNIIDQWRMEAKVGKMSRRFLGKSKNQILHEALLRLKAYAKERQLLRKVLRRWSVKIRMRHLKEMQSKDDSEDSDIEQVHSLPELSAKTLQDDKKHEGREMSESKVEENFDKLRGHMERSLITKTLRLWKKNAKSSRIKKTLLIDLALADGNEKRSEEAMVKKAQNITDTGTDSGSEEMVIQVQTKLKGKALRRSWEAWRREIKEREEKQSGKRDESEQKDYSDDDFIARQTSSLRQKPTDDDDWDGKEESDIERLVLEKKKELEKKRLRRILRLWRKESIKKKPVRTRSFKLMPPDYIVKKTTETQVQGASTVVTREQTSLKGKEKTALNLKMLKVFGSVNKNEFNAVDDRPPKEIKKIYFLRWKQNVKAHKKAGSATHQGKPYVREEEVKKKDEKILRSKNKAAEFEPHIKNKELRQSIQEPIVYRKNFAVAKESPLHLIKLTGTEKQPDTDERYEILSRAFHKLHVNAKDARLLRGTLSGLHAHSKDRKLLRHSIKKLKDNSETQLKHRGLMKLRQNVKERKVARQTLRKLHFNARNRKHLRDAFLEWKTLCRKREGDNKVNNNEEELSSQQIGHEMQAVISKSRKVADIRRKFELVAFDGNSEDTEDDTDEATYNVQAVDVSDDEISSISPVPDTNSNHTALLYAAFMRLKKNVEMNAALRQAFEEWRHFVSYNERIQEKTTKEKREYDRCNQRSPSDENVSDLEIDERRSPGSAVLRSAFEKMQSHTHNVKSKRKAFERWKSVSADHLTDTPPKMRKETSDSWPSLTLENKRPSKRIQEDSLSKHSELSRPLKDLRVTDNRRKRNSSSEPRDSSRYPSWISGVKEKYIKFLEEESNFKERPVKKENTIELRRELSGTDSEFDTDVDDTANSLNIESSRSDHNQRLQANIAKQVAGRSTVKNESETMPYSYDNPALTASITTLEDVESGGHYFEGSMMGTKEMEFSLEATEGDTYTRKDLLCPQCGRLYECPVLMRCAHTLCKDCVTELVEGSVDNSITCPLCKSVTKLSDADEELFCPNFIVLQSLESIERRGESLTCLLCKKPAVLFCEACDDLLCNDCAVAHKNVRYTMDHTLSPISQPREGKHDPKEYFCTKHHTERLNYHCKLCDVSVCELCAKDEHTGPKHSVTHLHEAGNEARADTDEIEVDLGTRLSELQLAIKDISRVKGALKDQVMYIKDEIRDSFERMMQALAERARELCNQVEDIHFEKVATLNEQVAQIQLRIIQLRNTKELMEKLKSHRNDIEMLQMKATLMSNVNEIETAESLEPQVEKDAFFFRSNEKAVKAEISKHGQMKHVDNEDSLTKDEETRHVTAHLLTQNAKEMLTPDPQTSTGHKYGAKTKLKNSPVSPEHASDTSNVSQPRDLLTMEEVTAIIREQKEASMDTDTSLDSPRTVKEREMEEEPKPSTSKGRPRAGSEGSKQTSLDTNPYTERSPEKSIVQQLISTRGEQVNVLKFGVKDQHSKTKEVEVKLTSPDKSIVSAHINENDNGTFTIFCCPQIDDDFNLFVSIGGNHFRKEKKVLNFYGTFAPLGKKELDLACRTIGLLRWHFTPGLLERKHGKVVPGRTLKTKQ